MSLTYKKESQKHFYKSLFATKSKSELREASGRNTQNSKVSQALFLSKLKDKLRHTAGIEDELLQMCGLTPG